MFDIVKGDLVKVVNSNFFINKPYYKVEDNMNLHTPFFISHPYKMIDDMGIERWLTRDDIIILSKFRNEIINEILNE